MRVVRDPATGAWAIDRSTTARRYDATDATQLKVVGQPVGADTDDDGVALPAGVVSGMNGNCSGGVTPWGTVFTGEENVQDSYSDLETAWTSSQKLVTGRGFDPGANVTFDTTPSPTADFGIGATAAHPKDGYGFLVEIDPGVAAQRRGGRVIARLAGVALDARVAARTRDLHQRALAAQWIAANVLGVSRIRATTHGTASTGACLVSLHATSLRAILVAIASVPVLVHPATLPMRWRAALRAFGVPVLDQPIEDALAQGASVALLAA